MKFGRITATLVVAIALGVGASASASASGKSTPAQDVAKAKQALEPYLKVPTKVLSTPLPKRPPSGQTVVFMECNNPACTLEGQGDEAAAKVLGWTFKEIPFQLANPSTLIAGMDSALQLKPVFVIETGVPVASFAGEVPKYKAAGVGIVVNTAVSKPNQTFLGDVKGERYAEKSAELLGDWFIEDSGAKGHALLPTFTSVSSSALETVGFTAFVGKNCSGCTVSSVDESLGQLAQDGGVSTTVSAVQANPDINYVIVPTSSAAVGLRAALDAAGRSDVKIAGASGTYQNLLNIASGTESASLTYSTGIDGYLDLDAGLHGMAGKKAQYKGDIYPPLMLVTKKNLANFGGPAAAKATGSPEFPANYAAQYAALWHIKQK